MSTATLSSNGTNIPLPEGGSSQHIVVVSAIVERGANGDFEVLLQTRWKPIRDPRYSGLIEIPAGCIENRENILQALRREVWEETRLHVEVLASRTAMEYELAGDKVLSFTPFCCDQQLSGGLPWVSLVFICRTESNTMPEPQEGETRDPQWISVKSLNDLLDNSPERFFPLHLTALRKYVQVRCQ